MMALYCTTAEVQSSLQNTTISSTTKPTTTDVDNWIIQVSAEIDVELRLNSFSLPVVGGLDFLKRICIFGVTANIYRSVDESETRWIEFQRLYEEGLSKFSKMGDVIFSTTSSSPIIAPSKTWDDRVDVNGDSTAPFQRNKIQW